MAGRSSSTNGLGKGLGKGRGRSGTRSFDASANGGGTLCRAEVLTRQIGQLAQRKELGRAQDVFNQMKSEGLKLSGYSYSNLTNAYVRSGDVEGAEKVFAEMKSAGLLSRAQGNPVVVYTTLLKGHGEAGNCARARELLDEMVKSGISLDVRAANTYIRACVRAGDVTAAHEAYEAMHQKWDVVPDAISHRLVVRLLSQGLRLKPMLAILRKLRGFGVEESETVAPKSTGPPCMFWKQGRCDRGVNCKFFHDPAIKQEGQEQADKEAKVSTATMNVDLAHAGAMLGKWNSCIRAIARAEVAHAEVNQACVENDGLFQELNHREIRREIDRISAFANLEKPPNLVDHLGRTFVFGQLEQESGNLPESLKDALMRTFGLDELVRLETATEDDFRGRFERCFTPKGRLCWDAIFDNELLKEKSRKRKRKQNIKDGTECPASIPMKLEICSGNGDWVVAQADAERGTSHWGALELRHDRVYSIFSRSVFKDLNNLIVFGGDAAKILALRVQKVSVDHIFINFPEPPHHSGFEGAESKNHLLTPEFFMEMHRVLKTKSRITIFSDNGLYMRSLLRSVAVLRNGSDTPAFQSASLPSAESGSVEMVAGLELHLGIAGSDAGHSVRVTSFFDRFWEHGQHVDRFYFVLQKVD